MRSELSKPSRVAQYPEIEGIRGALSLIVLMGHVVGVYKWPAGWAEHEHPLFWYWGCMEVFFCISGFLITKSLLASSAAGGRWQVRYLLKRALRIWPAYYIALLFSAVISLLFPIYHAEMDLSWDFDVMYWAKTFFFLQNTEQYWGQQPLQSMIPYFGHSWSVALEEQFYLLALLFISWRCRSTAFTGARIVFLLLLLLPLGQLARHQLVNGWVLLGRTEGFLFGMILAFAEPHIELWAQRLKSAGFKDRYLELVLLAFGLLPILPYLWSHDGRDHLPKIFSVGLFDRYVGFSEFAFFLLVTVIVVRDGIVMKALRLSMFRFLGNMSYSTYLIHVPVLLGLASVLEQHPINRIWIFVLGPLCALSVAYLSFKWVEEPFMKMKKRIGSAEQKITVSPKLARS